MNTVLCRNDRKS